MTRVVELASSDWLSGLFVYRRNCRRNYYRIKRRLSAVQTVFQNGGISQLQTVLGLHKTEELGEDRWSRLWSPTFRNEEGPRQGTYNVTQAYQQNSPYNFRETNVYKVSR